MDRPQVDETQARLRRFEAVGGVNLNDLDPEEQKLVRAMVIVGLEPHRRAIFHFICPICGNTAKNDQGMSPACTGPSWLDEHALEPMIEVTP